MKRRIILFLLNLIGGKKNQSTEEETHAKRAGCGCLLAIAFAPFLPILIFIILIVWISSSLMSCAAPVVLSEVFGVEVTEDDEKMLRAGLEEQKKPYNAVEEYFREKKLTATLPIAQAFYVLYMDKVQARGDRYLADLAYCFEDGVKLRNIQRIKERFGVDMTTEDMDVVVEYARDTRIPVETYRTYKNAQDLVKFARYATEKWSYRENTAGDILTIDSIYRSDNMDDWFALGTRTADNTGVFKGYLWLDTHTGNIELTSANTQLVQRYSTAEEILKASSTVFDIEDLEYIDPRGVGVYRKKDGRLGILTEEGVVTATQDGGISENPLNPVEWDTAFLFPGIEYEGLSSGRFVTIHAIVYSSTYTTAYLELWGYQNHVVFPLYFVDGVAEAYDEYFAPPDTLHARLYWEGGGLQGEFYDPPPEYGDYEYIEIRWSDDYIRVEYVID